MAATCGHGHPWTKHNTYTSTGRRRCRTCKRRRDRRRHKTPAQIERARLCAREWRRRQPPEYKAREHLRSRRRYRALKLEALTAYGGPVCVDCGETDFKSLGLDHVNEDGAEHRQAIGRAPGHDFYRALRRLGWPNDPPLQVRCRSCNSKATFRRRLTHADQDQ